MKLNSFARYAWAVALYNLAVILWGAYVRASGSGAGCGSHWPLCNGEVVPRALQTATLIEFTHRLTSGLVLPLVVALLVWALRAFPRKHQVRSGAVLTLIFVLTEALIGAGLVRFELVAGNASMARALFMSAHLLNTFLLLAVLTLTAWWASGGSPIHMKGQGAVAWLFGIGLLGTLVLGVSGAVAALGNTLFPASSLIEGLRQDFSPTAHILIRLRFMHPTLAVAVGCYLIFAACLISFLRPNAWIRRLSWAVGALVVTQLVAGLVNLLLHAPIWLQLVHLLLADLLWVALIMLTTEAVSSQAVAEERADELRFRSVAEV